MRPVLLPVKNIQKFKEAPSRKLFNSTIFGDQSLQKNVKSRFQPSNVGQKLCKFSGVFYAP